MLTLEQQSIIENQPSFDIKIALRDSRRLSIIGEPNKGFVEVAILFSNGHIDHDPPFQHDGFGIATVSRTDVAAIETLLETVKRS